MSISSNIETDARSREENRDVQTVETSCPATPTEPSCASMAENLHKVEEAGEFEEFTLDDIEVIESKVFA